MARAAKNYRPNARNARRNKKTPEQKRKFQEQRFVARFMQAFHIQERKAVERDARLRRLAELNPGHRWFAAYAPPKKRCVRKAEALGASYG